SPEARWLYLVVTSRALVAAERQQLEAMLQVGERTAAPAFWVAPRLGTTSPWSSKATDIAHVCGLSAIQRIERAIEYTVTGTGLDAAAIGRALSDRMTESVLLAEDDLAKVIAHGGEPRPLRSVAL